MFNVHNVLNVQVFFFFRHRAQAFLVKTVQSAFRITVKINITAIVFPVTQEDTARQVSLGALQENIQRKNTKKRIVTIFERK